MRQHFEAKLRENGVTSTMPEVVYTEEGAKMEVMSD